VPPDILRVTPRIELRAMTQAGGAVPVHGELRGSCDFKAIGMRLALDFGPDAVVGDGARRHSEVFN
jgi:hypothetical protein